MRKLPPAVCLYLCALAAASANAEEAFTLQHENVLGTSLELRVFAQGTIFARLIPLPNYFEMGRK